MTPRRRRGGGTPRRSIAAQPLKPSVLIFTEGEKTERNYLTHLYRAVRDKVIITFGAAGAPVRIVEAAIAEQRRKNRDGRPFDEIWCVFDHDEHPDIEVVRRQARDAGIHVAFSNPCFELWLVLHLEDQFAHIATSAVQRRSQALLGSGKALDDAVLQRLGESYGDAIQRARKLDEKHAGDGSPPGTNPSTGMWRLTERLRDGTA